MEWTAPAILLSARPYGEGDAVATVITEAHGTHRGLVRGGTARAHAATWQQGNLLTLRWVARLPDQLGNFTGELVHAGAALAMADRDALSILTAACAVAEGALPEREPHPRVFAGLLRLIAGLSVRPSYAELALWERDLLGDLGYGLDLASCAVTGTRDGLAYVSPRTGRAVSEDAAGIWRDRLFRLPKFLAEPLAGGAEPEPAACREALRLTGHFLARDPFGHQHKDLPAARRRLEDGLRDE